MERCARRFTITCEDCRHYGTDESCADLRCSAEAGHPGRHVYLCGTYSLEWDRTIGTDD